MNTTMTVSRPSSSSVCHHNRLRQGSRFSRQLLLCVVCLLLDHHHSVVVRAFSPRDAAAIGKAPPPLPTAVSSSSTGATMASRHTDDERRSELHRRVRDGSDYHHFPEWRTESSHQQGTGAGSTETLEWDDTPVVPAIFCGYRASSEDYDRLRSANVD